MGSVTPLEPPEELEILPELLPPEELLTPLEPEEEEEDVPSSSASTGSLQAAPNANVSAKEVPTSSLDQDIVPGDLPHHTTFASNSSVGSQTRRVSVRRAGLHPWWGLSCARLGRATREGKVTDA